MSKPKHEKGTGNRRILPKASLLATGALTLLGTVHANLDQDAHKPDAVIDVGWKGVVPGIEDPTPILPGLSFELGASDDSADAVESRIPQDSGEDSSGRVGSLQIVGHASEIVRQTIESSSKTPIDPIHMEWARLFSADPHSDKLVNPEALVNAAEEILSFNTGNSRVTEVVCQGTASDEDDYSDTHRATTNPGFGIPSQKNVDLATKRGATVVDMLAPLLTEEIGPIPIINAEGREVTNPDLADRIFEIAASKQMNPVDLVKEFNRGNYEHLSEQELEDFMRLRSDRFVQCVVTVETREVVETSVMTPVYERVGVQDTSDNPTPIPSDSTVEDRGGSSNKKIIIVLVPIVIPFIKKRIHTEDALDDPLVTVPPNDKTPVTIVDPPPPVKTVYPPPPPTPHHLRIQKHDVPKVLGRSSAGFEQTFKRPKQPRNHNFSGRPQHLGGRTGRSHGGSRSSKRG